MVVILNEVKDHLLALSSQLGLTFKREVLVVRKFVTSVTRPGQITLPEEIRRALGLHGHDRVALVLEGDQVQVRRVESIVKLTAGIFEGAGPVLSVEHLRDRAEQAIVDDVIERLAQ